MELLFEIGTEEIPPSYMRPALEDLKSGVKAALTGAGIGFSDIKTMGTPRRLVLTIEGLAEKAEDTAELLFGPPADKAFDESGKPTQAALGFAKSQGVDVTDLKTGKKGKGKYVCIEKVQEGALAIDRMGTVFQFELGGERGGGIRFPKTMRWEASGRTFARPIRWITYVIDGKPGTDSKGDRFSWAGIEAGTTTRGHRFLGCQEIKITSVGQYLEELERNFVIVDHEQRKKLIKELVDKAAVSVGGTVVPDDELLERVTFTVECPLAIAGSFSPKFLEMPRDVVVTALREHQDFFSVADADGKLMPHFVAVADMDKDRTGKIKRGNERVLKARLEDAHFYWEEDLKDGLDRMAERLSHVLWQEKLGTLQEKAERVTQLAQMLSKMTDLGDAERLKRAAKIYKADLTSQMVREKEFASLQGLMGREYALASGEDKEVADAIFEHYLPRFAGDILPETPTGQVLALADKLDTIVGYFGIGLKPTGSEDPYGLRRQAIGLTRIVVDKSVHLDIETAIGTSAELFGDRLPVEKTSFTVDVLFFVKQRLQNLLLDGGYAADAIESVLWSGSEDLVRIVDRLRAVAVFRSDERFAILITAYKRAYNITFDWEGLDIKEDLLGGGAEANLHKVYRDIKPRFDELMRQSDFRGSMQLLLELAAPIDVFFDEVMVMDKDENLKANRLSLLKGITHLFLQVADFTKLEVG